eukprot:Selendium_serpulae@DN1448_c0_g1_i1.p1
MTSTGEPQTSCEASAKMNSRLFHGWIPTFFCSRILNRHPNLESKLFGAAIFDSSTSRFLLVSHGRNLLIPLTPRALEKPMSVVAAEARYRAAILTGNDVVRIFQECNDMSYLVDLDKPNIASDKGSPVVTFLGTVSSSNSESLLEGQCEAKSVDASATGGNIEFYAIDISHMNTEKQTAKSTGEQVAGTPADSEFRLLRGLTNFADDEDAALLSTSCGVSNWHRTHLHCCRCGNTLKARKLGTQRICSNSSCQEIFHPQQDPAIITLVTTSGNVGCDSNTSLNTDDRQKGIPSDHQFCLLGRKHAWPAGRYSPLAGYVDMGEGVEQTVYREVLEEANVEADLSTLEFVASQPWLFPHSLMLGFNVRAKPSSPQMHDTGQQATFEDCVVTEATHGGWAIAERTENKNKRELRSVGD